MPVPELEALVHEVNVGPGDGDVGPVVAPGPHYGLAQHENFSSYALHIASYRYLRQRVWLRHILLN